MGECFGHAQPHDPHRESLQMIAELLAGVGGGVIPGCHSTQWGVGDYCPQLPQRRSVAEP